MDSRTHISSRENPAPIIIGCGPAGLTAAYCMIQEGVKPVLVESTSHLGGLSRTENYKGYRFDIGGHRFYTKIQEVENLWKKVLGPDFIEVKRLSRIYYRGKFFKYPLNFLDTLFGLGPLEGSRILLSYIFSQLFPKTGEKNFSEWVSNRFGQRLFNTFFKDYTEKVWGISCDQISSEWAAQRIPGLSLFSAFKEILFKRGEIKTLIRNFHYPRLGPGMMWEKMGRLVEQQGASFFLNSPVTSLTRQGDKIVQIKIVSQGCEKELHCSHVISTMPLSKLVQCIFPPPPQDVLNSAKMLRYRGLIVCGLVIDQENLFSDNWVYVHSPHVKVGRIQNYKNWSPEMVPTKGKTTLGLEYFCSKGDALWNLSDEALLEQAKRDLQALGLVDISHIQDGVVFREATAYPVYDTQYLKHLQVVQGYIQGITNLQTVGRAAMHRYNNQDHSMMAGMLAVKNYFGEKHALWNINTERSCYEEFQKGLSLDTPGTVALSPA